MEFKENGITFSSKFDSGNLGSIENFNVKEDSSGRTLTFKITPKARLEYERSYFHFSIEGLKKGDLLKVKLESNYWKMNRFGMRPIVRYGWKGEMKMIQLDVEEDLPKLSDFGLVDFDYECEMDEKVLYMSSFYVFPFAKVKEETDLVEEKAKKLDDVYFHREVLVRSVEGRGVELLTISSVKDMVKQLEDYDDELLFPKSSPRSNLFDKKTKKTVFVTARVHPAETPSSYVIFGFLNFLLHPTDPRSRMLREKFIFKIVPCLNPDGVYGGIYRYDSMGNDLNRCYGENSIPEKHPTVYGMKKYVKLYHEDSRGGCDMYIDCHSDPHVRDVYSYGNVLPPPLSVKEEKRTRKELMINHALFPKLIECNCQFFKSPTSLFCDSTEENKGTSRAIFGEYFYYSSLKRGEKSLPPFTYTIECNYFTSKSELNVRIPLELKNSEEFDKDLIYPELMGDWSCFRIEESKEDIQVDKESKVDEKEYYRNLRKVIPKNVRLKNNNLLANHHLKKSEVFLGASENCGPTYTPEIYRSVGKGLCLAILDFFFFSENEYSFVRTRFKGKELRDEEIIEELKKECERDFKKYL